MAEIKVSQLPEATQINDEDLLMIVQGNTNKKITKANAKFASGDEIFVGDTLPSGEDADSIKLWLTDDDALEGEGNYISNEYGTSQEIGYSQEYLNGKVLYESSTGENGSITLNDSSANYSKLDIEYRDNNNNFKIATVYEPNGKKVMLDICFVNGDTATAYYFCTVKEISGASLTNGYYGRTKLVNGSSCDVAKNDQVWITKVIGYK